MLRVHSFQSLGAVDGPGLRYVIFLQGCPYHCPWCHNPDTQSLSGGSEYATEELVARVSRYRSYFDASGGGVTLSGGEPLVQRRGAAELFRALHEASIRTALDTAGMRPDAGVEALLAHTDTVLCGDIARLYEQELGDAEFAGVRDRYGCRFFGLNYLNAGVLLLNLAKIRQTGLFRRALEACARKKIFLSDQTALNRCAARKKVLPRRFNEQKGVRGDTVIRHFSMTIVWFPRFHTQNVKPWQVERVHDILHVTEFDDILNDYLSRRPHFPAV